MSFYIVTFVSGLFYSWGTHDFGILTCMEAVSARRAGRLPCAGNIGKKKEERKMDNLHDMLHQKLKEYFGFAVV